MLALVIAAVLYLYLIYACGRCTAKLATQRGRTGTLWFVLGCLFFPVPSLVLALLPPCRDSTPISS